MSDDLLALDLARGFDGARRRALLHAFGSLQELGGASAGLIRKRTGWSRAAAVECVRALKAGRARVDPEREALASLGAHLVSLGSPTYPPLLGAIPDPPLLLRVRGTLPGAECSGPTACMAIVGSRRPTEYGRRQARRFACFFAEAGFHVVSGGARGIDTVAHRAAIEVGRPTCAILGGGLGQLYPPEHEPLFDLIARSGGCLASEYPVDASPRPAHFPQRNRIVSGLSVGVLVVEAAARSGALITARLAVEEHGREALAIPGRLEDATSAGCLRMLREGWAALVRTPEEALQTLEGARALLEAARYRP